MLLLALALLLLMVLLLVDEGTCVGSVAGLSLTQVSSFSMHVCTLGRSRSPVVTVTSRSQGRLT